MTAGDPQDPLPEGQFLYRRIFSYVMAVVLLGLLAWIVYRIDQSKDLADTAFWLIVLLWWVVTFYMIAPSAEQITKIIQAARIVRSGASVPRPLQPEPREERPVDGHREYDEEDVAPRSRRR